VSTGVAVFVAVLVGVGVHVGAAARRCDFVRGRRPAEFYEESIRQPSQAQERVVHDRHSATTGSRPSNTLALATGPSGSTEKL
jgi:hypothetical protein